MLSLDTSDRNMKRREKHFISSLKKGIAYILSLAILLGLWQVPVAAGEYSLEETIAGGRNNAYVIRYDGSLWAWGSNQSGQVGNGSTGGNENQPQKIMENIKSVFAGGNTAFAIDKNGTLWGWGENNYGQVGVGSNASISSPTRVMDSISKVFPQGDTVYALSESGELFGWGLNSSGEVGNGSTNNVNRPQKILDGVEEFYYFRGQGGTAYAITGDKTLWGWGYSAEAQAGMIGAAAYVTSPNRILDNVSSVYLTSAATYAVTDNNVLYGWGRHFGRIFGMNMTIERAMENVREVAASYDSLYVIKSNDNLYQVMPTPAAGMINEVKVLENVAEVKMLQENTAVARLYDDTVWTWGDNYAGQIGDGSYTDRDISNPYKAMENVDKLMVRGDSVFTVLNDGSLWAWGSGEYGGIGNGSAGNTNFPERIMDDVRRLVLSEGNSYLALENRSLYAWGFNTNGQVGDGTNMTRYAPVSILDGVGFYSDEVVNISIPPVSNESVTIPVEVLVRQAVGKLSGLMTDDDWDKLTSLDLSGMELDSLNGIERARNLREIDLSFATVGDILALAHLSKLRLVILKNSRVSADQLEALRRRMTQVEFRERVIVVKDSAVKAWNTSQTGDELINAAEAIIEKGSEQSLTAQSGVFVVDKRLAQEGARKAEVLRDELYAKSLQDKKELNKKLDRIVKVKLNNPASKNNIRIRRDVKELKEVDKLIVQLQPEVSIEFSSDDLQEGMSNVDMEIEIEEIIETGSAEPLEMRFANWSKGTAALEKKQGTDGESMYGGDTKKSKKYKVKMKKSKEQAKVGLSLQADENPYNAIIHKSGGKEQVVGGKFNAKTKRLTAKIGEDGEYYVRKNEKNFTDIEGLPTKQKEMIKLLASKGILEGHAGKFNPDSSIKRSEVLTIMVRLAYVYDKTSKSTFKDVEKNKWYYPYISSGVKIGVVNGYNDNTFKPNNVVGAAELAKMNTMMLVYKRGYRFPKDQQRYLKRLANGSKVPNWARIYIAMAEREGFLLKSSAGLYDGSQYMTRKQAAEMLYHLYQKL